MFSNAKSCACIDDPVFNWFFLGEDMSFGILAPGLALAGVFMATAVSAATVTATFEGQTSDGTLVPVGAPQELVIIGEDDAPATPITSTLLGTVPGSVLLTTQQAEAFRVLPSSNVASYDLTSMSYSLPGLGRSFSSTSVTGYIGDNVDFGGSMADAIFIRGEFMDGGMAGVIEYYALFAPTILAGTGLGEAIDAGIVVAPTIFEQAGVVIGTDRAQGRITITDLLIDTGNTGGGSGGGGSGGGGGGTPPMAPIPVPAGLPLLAIGLGGLGILRFKR